VAVSNACEDDLEGDEALIQLCMVNSRHVYHIYCVLHDLSLATERRKGENIRTVARSNIIIALCCRRSYVVQTLTTHISPSM
jgi:hypothetical protein